MSEKQAQIELSTRACFTEKSPVSARMWDLFEYHHLLGDLAVFESAVVLSLKYCRKPCSAIIVAPSGMFKSSVGDSMLATFGEERMIRLPSRFTPYGIMKEMRPDELARTWYVNDMVRTFVGLSKEKRAETLAFLSEIMSEHKSGAVNFAYGNKTLDTRMNFLGNLATIEYDKIKKVIARSTLGERLFIFRYQLDPQRIWTEAVKPEDVIRFRFAPVKLAKCVQFPAALRDALWAVNNDVWVKGYSPGNMRLPELISAWCCGHAGLNGRKEVIQEDLDVFRSMLSRLVR